MAGSDERLRASLERRRASDEIGLMRLEKAERGRQHRRFARSCAQVRGIETGHVEQPARSVGLGQRPHQRAKRECDGILICFWSAHCLSATLREKEHVGVAKRVLVVEDNELNLKLFCDLLRAHEYVAEPVRDGREAVARAREFAPELIVMDIQLPHVSGYELIEQLKADPVLKAIPIMAVTAYAGREDEERIRAAGADAYVSKPISLVRFVDAVGSLMALARPSGEETGGEEGGA